MWTNVVVQFPVQNQSVVHVIRRQIRIEWKHGIGVFSRVLKKILRNHGGFSQVFAALIKQINQHRFFPDYRAYIAGYLERRTSERVYRHNIAFVEPKADSGIELTFNRVLARYL